MTTTRASASPASARKVASSSSHICPLTAFFRAGRSSVIVATPFAVADVGSSRGADRTRSPTILSGMGFNPFRAQRRSTGDYVMVVVALVVCVLLVAWAVFG